MRKIIVFVAFLLALAGCSSDKAATEPEAKPAAEVKDAKAEAQPEAKADESKDAKPAEAKDAKDGEAAPAQIVTSPRDFRDVKAEPTYLVTIEAGKEYDIGVKGLAANVELKVGDAFRFQLTDLLESGKWVVRANDDQVVGVGLGVFKASLEKGVRSVTAVDLKAVKPGKSVLEMNYINARQSIQRVFRCYITVK